jgi:hypothetical protein
VTTIRAKKPPREVIPLRSPTVEFQQSVYVLKGNFGVKLELKAESIWSGQAEISLANNSIRTGLIIQVNPPSMQSIPSNQTGGSICSK